MNLFDIAIIGGVGLVAAAYLDIPPGFKDMVGDLIGRLFTHGDCGPMQIYVEGIGCTAAQ